MQLHGFSGNHVLCLCDGEVDYISHVNSRRNLIKRLPINDWAEFYSISFAALFSWFVLSLMCLGSYKAP